MPNTLAEYKYLGDASDVRMGIAHTIVTVSPWLQEMPFVEINNNVSKYKMEVSDGGANVYSVGDTWASLQPTWEDRDAPLAILGADADDDNFGGLAAGGEDTMGAILSLKSKSIGQLFEKLAIYGRTTVNTELSSSNRFKGLLRLIAECESDSAVDLDGWLYTASAAGANNKQVIYCVATTSATLILTMIDPLIDTVRPKPTHLIMSRLMRRKIAVLARVAGQNLTVAQGMLGQEVTKWGEQTVLIDDALLDNMDDPNSSNVTLIASYNYNDAAGLATSDTSPIFAVRFGEDGLCGINGRGMIQVEKFDKLESKDAKRIRIKFYAGMRLTNKTAAAVLLAGTSS